MSSVGVCLRLRRARRITQCQPGMTMTKMHMHPWFNGPVFEGSPAPARAAGIRTGCGSSAKRMSLPADHDVCRTRQPTGTSPSSSRYVRLRPPGGCEAPSGSSVGGGRLRGSKAAEHGAVYVARSSTTSAPASTRTPWARHATGTRWESLAAATVTRARTAGSGESRFWSTAHSVGVQAPPRAPSDSSTACPSVRPCSMESAPIPAGTRLEVAEHVTRPACGGLPSTAGDSLEVGSRPGRTGGRVRPIPGNRR